MKEIRAKPVFGGRRDLWEADGSLRDVYILDTTRADWAGVLESAQNYGYTYTFDGEPRPLPDVDEVFSNRQGTHFLKIHVGSVRVHAHFFSAGQVELDIDPALVKGPEEHGMVLEFLARVAQRVGKPVLVTPENSHDEPILTYRPDGAGWMP